MADFDREYAVNRLNHLWDIEPHVYRLQKTEYRPRGPVLGFSKLSSKRLTDLLRSLDMMESFSWFITLTYRPGCEYEKGHLNSFLTNLRRRYPGLRYVWVMEFQKRGVEHFHVIADHCPRSGMDLTSMWPHGRSQKKYLRRSDISQYIGKELSKQAQKFPLKFRGRWWGNSRNLVDREKFLVGDTFDKTSQEWKARHGFYALGHVQVGCRIDDRDGKGICFLRDVGLHD